MRMKKSCTLLLGLGLLALQACTQNPGFVPKNPYPGGGRDDAAAFVIGDKAYVGTGLITGWVNMADFYSYDPATDVWERRASLPGLPRQYASVFSLNGYGYLTCGIGAGNVRYKDTWKYDPAADAWTRLPDFPGTEREGMQTAVYAGNAYLFFGQKVTDTFFKQVWKFNGDTEAWTQLADFPSTPRYLSAHAQTDTAVYFVSGLGSGNVLTPEVWKFSLVTETWTQLADFPGLPRWYAKGVAFNGKLYFGTGWNAVFLNDFWAFDPATETWSQTLPIPALGRKGSCTFTVQNRAFVALGVNLHGDRTDEVWELVENAGVPEEEMISAFSVYPNPARTLVNIKAQHGFDAPNFGYRIMDTAGRVVQEGKPQAWDTPVDVSALRPGTYVLLVTAGKRMAAQQFAIVR